MRIILKMAVVLLLVGGLAACSAGVGAGPYGGGVGVGVGVGPY